MEETRESHKHQWDYADRNQSVIKCNGCPQKQVLRPTTRHETLALLDKQGEWAGPAVLTPEEKPNGNGHSVPDTAPLLTPEATAVQVPAVRDEPRPLALANSELAYIPPSEIRARLDLVKETMKAVMEPGVHFGQIPGTQKPTLFKPGAETLRLLFRLIPERTVERDVEIEHPHRGYVVATVLKHAVTGQVWGTGVGSCSTLEGKYRWRYAKRSCPKCSAEAIGKSRFAKGDKGWWWCKECKAQFDKADPLIMGQALGRVENEDIADQYNTVLKMASKRSFVAAILDATGASALFMAPPVGEEDEEDADHEDF